MDDIEQKVIEIVSEQMGVDKSEITRETHFINDLNADSLDTVELVMEFEDEFELSIPDEEAERSRQTVGQAVSIHQKGTSEQVIRQLPVWPVASCQEEPLATYKPQQLVTFYASPCRHYGYGRCHVSWRDGGRALGCGAVAGRSGVGAITRWDPSKYTTRFGGECTHFDVTRLYGMRRPWQAKRLDRFGQFGLAGVGQRGERFRHRLFYREDTFRCGVVIGSGIGENRNSRRTESHSRAARPIARQPVHGAAADGQCGQRKRVDYFRHQRTQHCGCDCAVCNGIECHRRRLEYIQYDQADVMIAGGSEAAALRAWQGSFAAARARPRRMKRRPKPVVPGTKAATDSSWPRVPAWLSWKNSNMPKIAARDLCRVGGIWNERRRPSHHCALGRWPRRGDGDESGAEGCRAVAGCDRIHQRPRHEHAPGRYR